MWPWENYLRSQHFVLQILKEDSDISFLYSKEGCRLRLGDLCICLVDYEDGARERLHCHWSCTELPTSSSNIWFMPSYPMVCEMQGSVWKVFGISTHWKIINGCICLQPFNEHWLIPFLLYVLIHVFKVFHVNIWENRWKNLVGDLSPFTSLWWMTAHYQTALVANQLLLAIA